MRGKDKMGECTPRVLCFGKKKIYISFVGIYVSRNRDKMYAYI